MQPLDYIVAGIQAVIFGPAAFELLGVPIPLTLVMVFAGVVTGILVGATPGLAGPMAMAISLPILFAVAVLIGIARGFAGPALSALSPNLVPKVLLPTAIAISTVAWQMGSILGAAMGGYLYSLTPALPYITAGGLFTLGFVCLALVGKVPQPAMRKDQRPIGAIVDASFQVPAPACGRTQRLAPCAGCGCAG